VSLVSAQGVEELPLMTKLEAAERIIDAAMTLRSSRPRSVA
jgi:hypothetical protein